MHYQLFIPGVRAANPQHLVDVGLADFVPRANFMDEATGPTGTGGVIVAWPRPGAAAMGYQPKDQKWVPAVARGDLAAGRYWLGLWTQDMPSPAELAQPYQQLGAAVALASGDSWLLPKPQELDSQLRLNDDGTWRFEPQRQFHAFWVEYTRWGQWFFEFQPGKNIDFSSAADFVLQALRINYRVVPELVNELNLFSTDSVRLALFTLMHIGKRA